MKTKPKIYSNVFPKYKSISLSVFFKGSKLRPASYVEKNSSIWFSALARNRRSPIISRLWNRISVSFFYNSNQIIGRLGLWIQGECNLLWSCEILHNSSELKSKNRGIHKKFSDRVAAAFLFNLSIAPNWSSHCKLVVWNALEDKCEQLSSKYLSKISRTAFFIFLTTNYPHRVAPLGGHRFTLWKLKYCISHTLPMKDVLKSVSARRHFESA